MDPLIAKAGNLSGYIVIYIVLISTKCVMIVTYCNGMSQLAIGHRMQHNVFGVHFHSYRLSAG